MHFLLRPILVALLLLQAAGLAHAEYPPSQSPQLRIETGMHTAGIWRFDVSTDGKLMVTASEDKTLRLWSTDDGRLLRTMRVPMARGTEGKLFSVAFSPDGKMIATGGLDSYYSQNYYSPHPGHYVYLFDTATGNLIRRIGPVMAAINDLDFSPDGKRLAAALALANVGIRVWDAPFDQPPRYDTGYANSTYHVDFAPNGSLAASSDDGFVRLYNPDFELVAKKAVPAGQYPRTLAFSPDGTRLAVSQVYQVGLDIISGTTLEPITTIDTSAYRENLIATEWSPDGQTLYAAGNHYDADWQYPIIAFSIGKPREIRDMTRGPKGGIIFIKTLPDGSIAYASHDPTFGIFDTAGKLRMVRQQPTVDMRNKYGGRFFNAADATSVWFGLGLGAVDPWLFDTNRLSFAPAPEIPAGFIQPVTDSLMVENWNNAYLPTIDKQVLPGFSAAEMARSLAIAPDKQSFVVGSDWALARHDASGRMLWRIWPEGFVWGVTMSADGQIIVAALGDGTLRWYRSSDGMELLSFFVSATDRKWIAWTPSGYYAASVGGEDLIGWHFNGKGWDDKPDFFPASRFRKQFYRPDIVQLVLKLRDEPSAISTANNLAGQKTIDSTEEPDDEGLGMRGILPGVVEFAEDVLEVETDRPDIELRYRLRSPSGRPITRVEVQIDGRPVSPRSVTPVEAGDDTKAVSLSVPPRDSEVTLIAYIDDQPGVPVSMPIRWTGKVVVEKKPRLFALLVGISNYENNDLQLRYAAKDAQDLAELLRRQEGVFYDQVEIKLLLNEDATEDAIEVELAKLRKKSAPEDNVIVFMAGHGFTDAAQDFYFLPTSVDLSPDMLSATAIDGDIIRKGLSRIPGKVTLFMDACHAGDGISGGTSMVDMSGLANGLADGASLVMFASSTGREVSYESSDWENGAFTEALLAALSDTDAYGDDGKLSISELDEELTTRVEVLTDAKQTPVMTKPGAVKRFFLAAL